MPRCKVCNHENRNDIETALLAGVPQREVATRYGLTPASVSRHKRNHMAMVIREHAELTAQNLMAYVAALQRQAQALKDKAEASGDYKVALSGIRELVRIVDLMARLSGNLDDRPQINIAVNPQWIEIRDVILDALAPYPEAQARVVEALSRQ